MNILNQTVCKKYKYKAYNIYITIYLFDHMNFNSKWIHKIVVEYEIPLYVTKTIIYTYYISNSNVENLKETIKNTEVAINSKIDHIESIKDELKLCNYIQEPLESYNNENIAT